MSPLRFFADHCVPMSIIHFLQEHGHEVLILREHIPKTSSDEVVIATAQKLGAILLSLNGDFMDIVSYPPTDYQGIIAIQLRNHPEILPHLLGRLEAYLVAHPEREHYRGKLFVVEVHRIRIRKS